MFQIEEGGGNVKVLSKEKMLADKNGWSLAQAEGYIDGETYRRRGKTPSTYARIGIDEYCLGFRAGYYERQNIESPYLVSSPVSMASVHVLHGGRTSLQGSRDSVEPAEAMTIPAHGG